MHARHRNTEAEERAREIRLRAERKCGQLLTVQIEHGGDRRSSSAGSNLKLKDLNISGDQSSQWQRLAAVPEDLFEQALSEPNPSTSGIITRHEVTERPAGLVMDNHQALWLWGTLQDFERRITMCDKGGDGTLVLGRICRFPEMLKHTRRNVEVQTRANRADHSDLPWPLVRRSVVCRLPNVGGKEKVPDALIAIQFHGAAHVAISIAIELAAAKDDLSLCAWGGALDNVRQNRFSRALPPVR
jgi:hypothetical protein